MCVVTSVLILEGWQYRLDPALHIHHGIQSVMTSEWKNTCNALRNATVATISNYIGGGSDVSDEHKSNPFAHQEARWRKKLIKDGEKKAKEEGK